MYPGRSQMMPWRGDLGPREPPLCLRLMASAQAQRDRSAAVDEDAVVLTSYFRERQSAGARFESGALMEACASRRVAASIRLCGIEGYGLDGPPPAADDVYPLAEGPPLTAIAVDTRPRIEALLDEVPGLTQARLVTVERARLLSGEIDPLWLGESAAQATKLTVYCWQADRVYQVPAFEAACELLYRRGIAGATVLSGTNGTSRVPRQRAPHLHHGGDAPLMLVAVGAGDRIGMALPELGGLFRHPLMTVATVRVCRRDGQFIGRPDTLAVVDPAAKPAGMTPRIRLTVYTSEAARHQGQPVHRAIIRSLRSADVGGATSMRGIWGFHGNHPPHGDHGAHGAHFPRHRHHVPVVTTVIDTPERISAAFDAIDPFSPGLCLVTAETVLTPGPAGVRTDRGTA